jgi:hypothetical protein
MIEHHNTCLDPTFDFDTLEKVVRLEPDEGPLVLEEKP